MTDAELLSKVKKALFGTDEGNWRDDTLTVYIDTMKGFMTDAGVPDEKIMSDASVGCIVMGVNDLWNYSGGGVHLSQFTIQRVIQLAAKEGES